MSTDRVSSGSRTDIVATESAPRPTPPPVRVNFKQALANAAVMAGRTAEAAVSVIPGSTVLSTALRGPAVPLVPGPMSSTGMPSVFGTSTAATPAVSMTPEGPGGAVSGGVAGAGIAGDPQATLAQSQANEMQMLMIQQQAAAQQNSFTTMSNLLKSESDTERAAINNIK